MRQKRNKLRIAAAALGASVVLPSTPSLAQDAPAVTPPPAAAPAPAPVRVTPPPPVATTPPGPTSPTATSPAPIRRPYTGPVPSETTSAPPAAETPGPRRPSAERPAPRQRAVAPTPRRAAPAPAPAPEPAAEVPAPAPVPEAVAPPPATTVTPLPVEPAPAEAAPASAETNTTLIGLLAAAGILLLGALAFLLFRRRRTADEYYEETVYETPVAAAEPAVAPADAARSETVGEPEIAAPRDADVAALAATSAPASGRPWLEFLMRPVRAGTLDDEARVEFELTVGNTGTVPAKDVRISTWMFAAGDSEMERMLIEPPASAQRSEVDIPPGDGARVDTTIALPRESLKGSVLPVVVADARYRLPDGSEGRTSASFAVGLPNGDGLEPFAVDLPSGLHEDVEARLHGEPQRV